MENLINEVDHLDGEKVVLEEVIPFRPVTIHAAAQIIFDPDQTNFLADVATVQEIRARRDRPRRNDTAISLTSFEHIFVLRRDVIVNVDIIFLIFFSVLDGHFVTFDLVGNLVCNLKRNILCFGVELPRCGCKHRAISQHWVGVLFTKDFFLSLRKRSSVGNVKVDIW